MSFPSPQYSKCSKSVYATYRLGHDLVRLVWDNALLECSPPVNQALLQRWEN